MTAALLLTILAICIALIVANDNDDDYGGFI
jgi:hypothetical protein